VGDLHAAGDAEVVLGVGVDHVAAAGDDEAAFLLEAADVLGDEQRGLELLAQALMAEGGDGGVAIRVLVPEEARLVAGAADVEGVHECAELAGRVEHQRQLGADAGAHGLDVRRLAPAVAVVPAVDLEALVRAAEIAMRCSRPSCSRCCAPGGARAAAAA
jgi:hypothetical protein